jgi:hypothetical protein
MTMLSYVFLAVAAVALVMWVMRRSANKRTRGR